MKKEKTELSDADIEWLREDAERRKKAQSGETAITKVQSLPEIRSLLDEADRLDVYWQSRVVPPARAYIEKVQSFLPLDEGNGGVHWLITEIMNARREILVSLNAENCQVIHDYIENLSLSRVKNHSISSVQSETTRLVQNFRQQVNSLPGQIEDLKAQLAKYAEKTRGRQSGGGGGMVEAREGRRPEEFFSSDSITVLGSK